MGYPVKRNLCKVL